MIVDAGGQGSALNAMLATDIYHPPSTGFMDNLSQAGRQVWEASQGFVQGLVNRFNNMFELREQLADQGIRRDANTIHGVSSVEELWRTEGLTRDYLMAHPALVDYHQSGGEVYPDYMPSSDHNVLYNQVMSGVVQYSGEDAYVTEQILYGYDDIPELTKRECRTLAAAYQFMEQRVIHDLDNLVLGDFEEYDGE